MPLDTVIHRSDAGSQCGTHSLVHASCTNLVAQQCMKEKPYQHPSSILLLIDAAHDHMLTCHAEPLPRFRSMMAVSLDKGRINMHEVQQSGDVAAAP